MDYLEFYGLEQEPFSSAPISKFYYNSAQHQRALVRLMYAVDTMKGLAVLIGDLGTGKTTLARRMLDNLPEEEYESALLVIIHSGITADWLLSRIARQLGVEDPAPEKLKLLNQLYNRLVELHEDGKKAVVLIDEAQMLSTKELMEEFRGMLNLELPESKLITFVFFGLPELEENLHLDEPLAQRVSLKCNLESFTLESTQGYINHRLRLAGISSQLFTPDAVKLVHHYSRGIPRLINTICDNALFEGYLLKKKAIEAELLQGVATDLGLATQARTERKKGGAPARVSRLPERQQAVPGQGPYEPPTQAYQATPAAPLEGHLEQQPPLPPPQEEPVEEFAIDEEQPFEPPSEISSEESFEPPIFEEEEPPPPSGPPEEMMPPEIEDTEEAEADEFMNIEEVDDEEEVAFSAPPIEPEAAAPPPPPPPAYEPPPPPPPPTPSAPPFEEDSEDLDSMFNDLTETGPEPAPPAPPNLEEGEVDINAMVSGEDQEMELQIEQDEGELQIEQDEGELQIEEVVEEEDEEGIDDLLNGLEDK